MLRQLFKSMVVARQAAAAIETLNHMSDRQLEDIGFTRATYVDQIKASVLAELDAQDAAKAASAPVNDKLSRRRLISAYTATVLAEAISGSEAPFARRMNRTAKELGMTRSTFQNPHGLTERGHLSTARDIATIMQALDNDFADFMQYIYKSVHKALNNPNNTAFGPSLDKRLQTKQPR